jgi:uracil-DNA glycosylase
MLPLPSSCQGCPFYGKGRYFTPDRIVPGSKVMFIAQNPGPDEEEGKLLVRRSYANNGRYANEYRTVTPQPLIGATGKLFNNEFLPLSKLHRHEVSLGNVIRCRPGAALGLRPDGLPPITTTMHLENSKADIVRAMKHCREAHLHIPDSVETIVTMGRHAMFLFSGIQHEESEYGHYKGVMESWRGYGVDSDSTFNSEYHTIDTSFYHPLTAQHRIYFTLHIAALFQPAFKKLYHATLEDFHKLRLLQERKWPKPLAPFDTTPPIAWPQYAAFDTEYVPIGNQLIRWSLCDTHYNLYCVEAADTPDGIPILPGATTLAQNWLADYAHFSNIVDVSQVKLEDLMLAHSVWWTGEPHDLGYINSIYGTANAYKHLINSEDLSILQTYASQDAYQPMFMWKNSFVPFFKNDPLSWKVYRDFRLGLITIINKSQLHGSKVDTTRLANVKATLEERISGYRHMAMDITGDDTLNLGGRKKMLEYIYE